MYHQVSYRKLPDSAHIIYVFHIIPTEKQHYFPGQCVYCALGNKYLKMVIRVKFSLQKFKLCYVFTMTHDYIADSCYGCIKSI
jgi:hypothetical protein